MSRNKFLFVCFLTFLTLSLSAQGSKKFKFKDLYFTNAQGERIEEIDSPAEFVYLVVETKNGIGQVVSLELEENDDEFIYKKQYITNNDVIDIMIESNHHKIKLLLFKSDNEEHVKLKERRCADLSIE